MGKKKTAPKSVPESKSKSAPKPAPPVPNVTPHAEAAAKKTKKAVDPNLPMVECMVPDCGHKARCLTSHLKHEHGMTGNEYTAQYGGPLFAPDILEKLRSQSLEASGNDWNGLMKLLKLADQPTRNEVIDLLVERTGVTMEEALTK